MGWVILCCYQNCQCLLCSAHAHPQWLTMPTNTKARSPPHRRPQILMYSLAELKQVMSSSAQVHYQDTFLLLNVTSIITASVLIKLVIIINPGYSFFPFLCQRYSALQKLLLVFSVSSCTSFLLHAKSTLLVWVADGWMEKTCWYKWQNMRKNDFWIWRVKLRCSGSTYSNVTNY